MHQPTWETVQCDWDTYKGQVKARWSKLTDDDLNRIGGSREQLLAVLQERYGLTRDRLEDEVSEFADIGGDWKTKAKHKFSTFLEKGKEYYRQHKIGEMVEDAKGYLSRNPVPSTLAGIAVGYLLGHLLTRRRS